MVRQNGLAERHYATMALADIKALPVSTVAARDSVLFLWCIDCMLPEALRVGDAWGFTFKTVAFTWAKSKAKSEGWHIGLGYWTRGNPEMCLLFTRGKPRRQSAACRQLIVAPRREHSRKPDEQYERIEALMRGPYLELFSRQKRDGWESWGNQSSLFSSRQHLSVAEHARDTKRRLAHVRGADTPLFADPDPQQVLI